MLKLVTEILILSAAPAWPGSMKDTTKAKKSIFLTRQSEMKFLLPIACRLTPVFI
jgi:hypothetical protein